MLAVKAKLDAGEKLERDIIFEGLLAPGEGYVVPTPDQIKDESYAILNAASDTTGNAMTVSCYHVVKDPEIYHIITKDLKDAFPDDEEELSFVKLEKLPYLVCLHLESLALSLKLITLDWHHQRRASVR